MLAPRFKNNMKSIGLQTLSSSLLLSPLMKLCAFMGKQKSRRMSASTRLKRKILLVLDFQNFSLNMKRWRTDAFRGKAKMKITIVIAAQNLYSALFVAKQFSIGWKGDIVVFAISAVKQTCQEMCKILITISKKNLSYMQSLTLQTNQNEVPPVKFLQL